jgi:hypothetical protein
VKSKHHDQRNQSVVGDRAGRLQFLRHFLSAEEYESDG